MKVADEDLTMLTRQTADGTTVESIRIGADGAEYQAILDKRFNKRFALNPFPDLFGMPARWL
jgi:hypothetical protein